MPLACSSDAVCKHRTRGPQRSPASRWFYTAQLLIKRSWFIFHTFKSLSMHFLLGLPPPQMIKLAFSKQHFIPLLISPTQMICCRTSSRPLGFLWGSLVGRVYQMLLVFSSMCIIDPISNPEIVYWQVQGRAPFLKAKGCTELPCCWLEWFHTFSQIRQHKHPCF